MDGKRKGILKKQVSILKNKGDTRDTNNAQSNNLSIKLNTRTVSDGNKTANNNQTSDNKCTNKKRKDDNEDLTNLQKDKNSSKSTTSRGERNFQRFNAFMPEPADNRATPVTSNETPGSSKPPRKKIYRSWKWWSRSNHDVQPPNTNSNNKLNYLNENLVNIQREKESSSRTIAKDQPSFRLQSIQNDFFNSDDNNSDFPTSNEIEMPDSPTPSDTHVSILSMTRDSRESLYHMSVDSMSTLSTSNGKDESFLQTTNEAQKSVQTNDNLEFVIPISNGTQESEFPTANNLKESVSATPNHTQESIFKTINYRRKSDLPTLSETEIPFIAPTNHKPETIFPIPNDTSDSVSPTNNDLQSDSRTTRQQSKKLYRSCLLLNTQKEAQSSSDSSFFASCKRSSKKRDSDQLLADDLEQLKLQSSKKRRVSFSDCPKIREEQRKMEFLQVEYERLQELLSNFDKYLSEEYQKFTNLDHEPLAG